MHQLAGRIGRLGSILGIFAAFSSCGGNDLTLPGDVGPARLTKVDGDKQTGSVGAELPLPLKIQVLDQRGAPVRNQPVAFSVVNDVPGAAVTADPATGPDGTATARWVLGSTSGSQKVRARVVGDGLPDSLEATFEAVAGSSNAARILLEDGDGQSGAVGTALDNPLVVRVTDQFGNPVAGVEVSWTAENGNVDPHTSTSDADGKAETSWVLGSSTGTQSASASSAGLDGSPVSFTAEVRPGSADKLVRVSGDNQSGKPGQDLAASLVIRLVDRDGNGVPGRAVSWVVGVGGGRVSPETNTTGANGEAETRWTLGAGGGTNTVNAVVSGIGFVTFSATATNGGNGGNGDNGGGNGGNGGS